MGTFDSSEKRVTILFDLDGTLIDSTEAILESFGVAFEKFGSSHPGKEAIKALVGHPLEVMFFRLGVPKSMVSRHVDAYKEHYREISCRKTVLLPGAREAVVEAAEFARLGVVTTKTGRYSKELLEYMGLMEHFEVLIGREDVKRPKPHPEPILKALAVMGCAKERCWMVGDTFMDVEAAMSAGVRPFALKCGYGTEKELAAICDNLADNAAAAVRAIRTAMGC